MISRPHLNYGESVILIGHSETGVDGLVTGDQAMQRCGLTGIHSNLESDAPLNAHDAVFRIVPKLYYENHANYIQWQRQMKLKNQDNSSKAKFEDETARRWEAKEQERKRNADDLSRLIHGLRCNQVVLYGDVLQVHSFSIPNLMVRILMLRPIFLLTLPAAARHFGPLRLGLEGTSSL